MSSGTNSQRIIQNNTLIGNNNDDIDAIKAIVNNLPTSGDTTATASDILLNKTAVSKGIKLTGTLGTETKTVKSTTSSQTVTPTSGKLISEITVSPIDLETKTVTPSTSQQIITPSVNKDGISEVTVNAVTSSIDNNITAGNIKKNVEILGVTGTYEGSGGGGLNIYIQTATPSTYDGIWIKSNSYTYSAIKEISAVTQREANTLNIVMGDDYLTHFDTDLTYRFNQILITDSNNDIQYDIEVYYGDGSRWVDITPLRGVAGISVDFINETITDISSSSVYDLNCYSGRRRCNMNDAGAITAYYGDVNYDNVGSSTSQVMVEQPQVFYSVQNVVVDSNGAIEKADYLVADTPINNKFSLHPAFIRNNVIYDKVYIGAYEGTVVDNKLSSIGGGTSYPTTNLTRAQFRTYASNRGSIWTQTTKQYEDLESLLMTIELKSFNHQASFATGVIGSSNKKKVGETYALNASGTGINTTTQCFTWRWRENKYGNCAKYNDGINPGLNSTWWIKDNNFEDNTFTGYTQLSATFVSGWIKQFAYVPEATWIFMPKVDAGSQTGLIQDRYWGGGYQGAIYASGGPPGDGQQCGSFYALSNRDYTNTDANRGSCLLAMPLPNNS